MNDYFNIIRNDRIILYSFFSAITCIFLALLYLLFFISKLPPFLPLFNQMPWGEGRLGVKLQIFFPIILVLGITLGNSVVSSHLYTKIPLLARILSIISLLVAFLGFLFIVRTIGLLL